MKLSRLLLLSACLFPAGQAIAQEGAFDTCREHGFYVDMAVVDEERQSPRDFSSDVRVFALNTNHTAYMGAGFAIIFYPGEGDNMACMGRQNFRSVDIANATSEFTEGVGLTVSIPVQFYDGGYDEETQREIFEDRIVRLLYNPETGAMTELGITAE